PTVTLTPSNGASVLGKTDNCASPGATSGAGNCTVVFHSNTAGQVTGHATVTFSVGGVPLTRATTGTLHSQGDAVKTYVDARINIGPAEATNTVGDPHVFTVTIDQDDGLSAAQGGDGVDGFTPAPNGTFATVNLSNSDGANWELTGTGDKCVGQGN